MTRLTLIADRARAYATQHPPRFVVVGHTTTRHRHIETALHANTVRQARVVVRIADQAPMTAERRGPITPKQVDRLARKLERAKPADFMATEELPEAGESEDQ